MFASSKTEEKKLLATKLVWLWKKQKITKHNNFCKTISSCLFSPFRCNRLSNLSGKLIFPPSICTFNENENVFEFSIYSNRHESSSLLSVFVIAVGFNVGERWTNHVSEKKIFLVEKHIKLQVFMRTIYSYKIFWNNIELHLSFTANFKNL